MSTTGAFGIPQQRIIRMDEVSLAFLRVYATRKVGKHGMLHWCPPNGKEPDWRWYQDNALLTRVGGYVQMRLDLSQNCDPPRLFVFERGTVTVAGSEMETWVPVACGGPMGSVPPMTGVAVFSATKDQLRDSPATLKKAEAWLAKQMSDADLAKYDFGKETKTDE
jgi:hypothetical protein